MKRRICRSAAVRARAVLQLAAFACVTICATTDAAEKRDIAFVQAPSTETQTAGFDVVNSIFAGSYVQGMRVVTADSADIAGTRRVVSENFSCATDPVYSHDGSKLAFVGQRPGGRHLQIWELRRGELVPRQVFSCEADCLMPTYLPNGHIVFAAFLSREYEEHGGRYATSLYEIEPGGNRPTRLTFNPSSDFDPAVLPDGRILYSSWQHVGNHFWPSGAVALMLVNSDGTGLFPLTGNHRAPWLKRGAGSIDGDRIAFVQADRFEDFGAGTLVPASLNDAFAPYRPMMPAEKFSVADFAAVPGGGLLLSARPSDRPTTTFGLYRFENDSIELLYDDPRYHELAPASGTPKQRPELRISTVVPGTRFGYLTVLNCYESDRSDQHALQPGSVKTVRVIEGLPPRHDGAAKVTFVSVPGREDEPLIRPNSATGIIPARILGEVPPAADGSIYLKVPADRPLRLQLIDHQGFAIVNERAWFWVRPNERRVCIGCHENRELSPNNIAPLAVQKMPTDLTDPAGWQTVSFRQDIQPILSANCALSDCHVPPTPTAGMNLTADRLNGNADAVLADLFGPAYANLLARQEKKPFAVGGRRVHPGDARSSPMMWMLHGKALAAQYKPAPFERPMLSAHPGPMLPENQLDLIRKWIDLGALYDDHSPVGPWPYAIPQPEFVEAKHGSE